MWGRRQSKGGKPGPAARVTSWKPPLDAHVTSWTPPSPPPPPVPSPKDSDCNPFDSDRNTYESLKPPMPWVNPTPHRTPRLSSMTHVETGLQTGRPIRERETGARGNVFVSPLPPSFAAAAPAAAEEERFASSSESRGLAPRHILPPSGGFLFKGLRV